MNSTREELLFALALTRTVAERSVWLDGERGFEGDSLLLNFAREGMMDGVATYTGLGTLD